MRLKSSAYSLAVSVALVVGCNKTAKPRETALQLKHSTSRNMASALLGESRATPLRVSSPAFKEDGIIPTSYSAWGEDASPPITIRDVPREAKTLLVIMEDPDAKEPKPFVHWVLFNVPANVTELRTSIPGKGRVRELSNALQGANSRGSIGYFGPRPPEGDPAHHYHFQVFALDTKLSVSQGATKAEVVAAARGRVVAVGELVGLFEKAKSK